MHPGNSTFIPVQHICNDNGNRPAPQPRLKWKSHASPPMRGSQRRSNNVRFEACPGLIPAHPLGPVFFSETTTAQTLRLSRRGELWVFEYGHRGAAIAEYFHNYCSQAAITRWRYPSDRLLGWQNRHSIEKSPSFASHQGMQIYMKGCAGVPCGPILAARVARGSAAR